MSQAFNPYREWLGVTSHSETPSYYELLGLRPLELDTGKIEAAYHGQSARLAAQLSSGHAEVAQRLLGELAEARMTLLTPTAKRAYDTALANAGQTSARTAPTQASPNGNNASMVPSSAPSAAATGTAVPAPAPAAPQPLSAPVYGQAPTAGYAGQAYGYGAAPVYGPGQGYVAAPAYPGTQAYPGWQGQQGTPTAVQSGPAPAYYAAPAASYPAAPNPVASESPTPSVRPRRARRRSSPVPALAGVAVAVLAVVGGMWYYHHRNEPVALVQPNVVQSNTAKSNNERTIADDQKPVSRGNREVAHPSDKRPSHPKTTSPSVLSDADSMSGKSARDPVMPTGDGNEPGRDKPGRDKPGMDKPADENPKSGCDKPEPEKPQPDKPAPDKPEPEKPKDEPKPEMKASAEELEAVGKLLKSARAALANRDISQAQDLIAEATIEATAPDTTAEVNRVEMLSSYVEMFWDAVRKTLPKMQLAELTINGTMIVVVEADADHLVIRAEGKNREYTWQKIPKDIAYYLADRWLAPDDPVRNLVLASFEIVDPKGDRNDAKSLLDAAAAANLNAEPLLEELQSARGK